MAPLRADEETAGGVFHKRMFERLVVCEFAIADLSTGNPNVFYELGVRHGVRPYSTVLIFRDGWRLPLDVALDGALPYPVDASGEPIEIERTRRRLVDRLRAAREATMDSPVFQLVGGLPIPEVDHARIDMFREHRDRNAELRHRLDDAVESGLDDVRALDATLGPERDRDIATVMALLTAYRSVESWDDMIRAVRASSRPVQRLEVVRQQLGFALNRAGRGREAERVLCDLLEQRPSSETSGLLGRVYKDRWRSAAKTARAVGLVRKAIEVYVRGFETDMRDPYPGINAVLLMSTAIPEDPRLPRLLPVVRYAVERRLNAGTADYWDHASELALAVIDDDQSRASHALETALAAVRDTFEPATSAADLRALRDARVARGEGQPWLDDVIGELDDEAARRR
jgi:hypothetical protein